MKVLSISTDRKIFDKDSAVRARAILQGEQFGELHIIVYSLKQENLEAWRIADNVWAYPTNSSSKFWYASDAVAIAKKLAVMRKFTSDDTVVTCQDPFDTGMAGVKIKKKLKLALQLQIHTDFMSPYFRYGSFLNKIRIYLGKRNLPRADRIRVVSKRIAQSLIPLHIDQNKVDILPIYTDVSKFSKEKTYDLAVGYPQFTFIILMASRLEPEKNISSALRIHKKIVERYPKTGLVIFGNGSESEKLKQEAKTLGLEDAVSFEPWHPDLNSYYKSCHAFLLTSLYEGYGLTLVEAGLCGAAIVTSDVGIVGDVLKDGENCLVAPINNEAVFVEKMAQIINDNAVRQLLKKKVADDMPHAIISTEQLYFGKYRELLEKILKKS